MRKFCFNSARKERFSFLLRNHLVVVVIKAASIDTRMLSEIRKKKSGYNNHLPNVYSVELIEKVLIDSVNSRLIYRPRLNANNHTFNCLLHNYIFIFAHFYMLAHTVIFAHSSFERCAFGVRTRVMLTLLYALPYVTF